MAKNVTVTWTCDVCGGPVKAPVEGDTEYVAFAEIPILDMSNSSGISRWNNFTLKASCYGELCTACEFEKLKEAWELLLKNYQEKLYGEKLRDM